MTRAAADEYRARQPLMRRGRSLEDRRAAEIIRGGVDRLAGEEPLHHRRGPVAQAAIDDADERAVIGLERVARLELGDAVGPDDLPVGAARQHHAAEPWSRHRAAGDGDDAAPAEMAFAELERRRHADVEREDKIESWRVGSHGAKPRPSL